jgi:multiple sugar transport system ATP-binding protein
VRLQDGAGSDGQRVIYGVRPEHLAYGAPARAFPTTVTVVEPTGADTEVYSRFGETDFTVFRERHDFAAGQALHLVPDHHHTHLFDAESGQALPRQTARQ